MDVHLHNSRTLHYGLNDRTEDDLQFLSLEERECILFFEETIGSLEDEEEERTAGGQRLEIHTTAQPSPADQDIIDLVHPTDQSHKPTETPPVLPDFRQLVAPPETRVEVKARRDSDAASEEQPPTPVVNTEHQGVIQRRSSLELPQNPSAKHGPPTHAKPTRLPESISLLLGSREHIPHSIAAEAVSVQERRALMLSNLSGAAHPLDGGEPACVRNLPMRSVSFRDPTPDKSRMEALSKLGLAQRRTQSVIHSPRDEPKELNKPASRSSSTENSTLRSDAHSMDTTDHKATHTPMLTSAEVTHSEFNSFGGKSITVNPMVSSRTEPPSVTAPEVQLNNVGSRSRVISPSEPNHGVRSKTFTPMTEDRSSSEDSSWRKRSTQAPTPAPRPLRQQGPNGSRPPLSPEQRRKSLPKPSFRTQGITVQFSGRGTTDEARRDALRKLGLLRDTS